jgi:hypothetical protein
MKIRHLCVLSIAAILLIPTAANARKVTVSPAKVAAIVSPSDSRDSRVLLFFELPSDVMNPRATVDFATLHCKAQVMDAAMGQIDIFPMATEWKDKGTISWNAPWKEPGGDYSGDFLTSNYSLKSEFGVKEVAINVTEIVQKWQKGELANNGIMLKLSADDLKAYTNLKYAFDQEKVLLRIFYSYEYK